MFLKFYQELYKNFIKNGFNSIKGFSDKENISEDTKFIGVGKSTSSSVLYVVIIFNMNILSIEELYKISVNYTRLFDNIRKNDNFKNVIITNILLTENYNDKVNYIIENLKPFESNTINNIFWGVQLDIKKIIINENNPTKIINIKDIILECLNLMDEQSINYSYEKSINHLTELGLEEQVNKIKEKTSKNTLTIGLILINFIMLFVLEFNGGFYNLDTLIKFGALVPDRVINNKEYYRLFLTATLHSGFTHLLSNSISLYIFGSRVERFYGEKNFFVIYLFSIFTSSIFSIIFTNNVSVGASGAIFGTIGALGVMTKVFNNDIEGFDFYSIFIYVIISILLGFEDKNIDNFGHLGGLIGGILISLIICYFMKKDNNKNIY